MADMITATYCLHCWS